MPLSEDTPFLLFVFALGVVNLLGARKRWTPFVDPPRYLFLVWPQAFWKCLFGARGALIFSYVFGAWFAFFGFLLLAVALAERLGFAPPPS